jgi:hypothetical protein
VLQNLGPGLLPSPEEPRLGPLSPLRDFFSTRQSSLGATACSFALPRFGARVSPDAGEFTTGLLWRLARAGLSPAGWLGPWLGTRSSGNPVASRCSG